MTSAVTTSWYDRLVDDCRTIVVECGFTARWALVEGYWQIGMRILAEQSCNPAVTVTLVEDVARDLGKNQRTIERAIQFARQFPDLNSLPEGKNTSWHQICNKYLPNPKAEPKTSKECPQCGYRW